LPCFASELVYNINRSHKVAPVMLAATVGVVRTVDFGMRGLERRGTWPLKSPEPGRTQHLSTQSDLGGAD
jgi:hypothetical protein